MSESSTSNSEADDLGRPQDFVPFTLQEFWRGFITKNVMILFILIPIALCNPGPLETVYCDAWEGDDLNSLLLVATVSGLALAGAISGFFTFSFGRTVSERSGGYSRFHLRLGYLATGLAQLVIGVLLVVAVSCIEVYPPTSHLGVSAQLIGLAIYLSAVAYDAYDLFALFGCPQP